MSDTSDAEKMKRRRAASVRSSNKWRAAHPERAKAQARTYYVANKVRIAKQHGTNKKHIATVNKAWHEANKEHMAAYRAANKVRRAEYMVAYRAANKKRGTSATRQ